MNTDSLQVFVDLVSTLNLRKTADNFSISEPTVSYRLRQLESFLGKDLFVRSSSKRIEITDFGKKFYPDAIKILRILDYHQNYGKSISPNGEIKISSGEIAAIHLLPSLIKSFEDKHPEIKVVIEIDSSLNTIKKIEKKEVDLGFVISTNFPEISNVISRLKVVRLVPVELIVIAPKQHPVLMKKEVAISDLLGYPYLSRSGSSGVQAEINRILKSEKLTEKDLNVVFRFENSSSIISAVSEGLGISIATTVQASKQIESGMIGHTSLKTDIKSYLHLIDGWNGSNERINSLVSFVKFFISSEPKWSIS